MKYGIGKLSVRSDNFILIPTIVVYPKHRYWGNFEVVLRFLSWGIGFYVYGKERK